MKKRTSHPRNDLPGRSLVLMLEIDGALYWKMGTVRCVWRESLGRKMSCMKMMIRTLLVQNWTPEDAKLYQNENAITQGNPNGSKAVVRVVKEPEAASI